MADDGPLADEADQAGQHVVQARCAGHVLVTDAGQFGDLAGNGTAGVDEGGEGIQHLVIAELDCADLGDGVTVGVEASGLQVEGYVGLGHVSSFLGRSRRREDYTPVGEKGQGARWRASQVREKCP